MEATKPAKGLLGRNRPRAQKEHGEGVFGPRLVVGLQRVMTCQPASKVPSVKAASHTERPAFHS